MFFYLSKTLWFFIDPGNAFLMVLIVGLILTATRLRWLGQIMVAGCILSGVLLTFVPIGGWMRESLETRFPAPNELPENVTGIVVLGGVVEPRMTALSGTLSISGAVERITVSADLAKRYPNARLIYSGGNGSIRDEHLREADYVSELYEKLGVAAPQLQLEREARNTWENAEKSFDVARPEPSDTWILVTSAFHMPRAIGVFRRFGWEMLPYPVDFASHPSAPYRSPMSFSQGLGQFTESMHEWIGLSVYWLTGKIGSAFPKPRSTESS